MPLYGLQKWLICSQGLCHRSHGPKQLPLFTAPPPLALPLQVSLSSRVACIGANGAGKSTLIKVLTGETEATAGTVWKHPNLRIAYVAQVRWMPVLVLLVMCSWKLPAATVLVAVHVLCGRS